MKLHDTVVEQLLKMYDVWGGHREDTKLRKHLGGLDFTVYSRQDGQDVLVLTSDYNREANKTG